MRADRSDAFERALLALDRVEARRLFEQAASGPDALRSAIRLVGSGLERIGAGWERGTVALSQVYMGGRICEDLIERRLPPGDPQRASQPRLGLAVLADHHVLGMRIVRATLRAAGYEATDYGHGIGARELAERALGDRIEVLLVSTLMLPSALQVKELSTLLRAGDSLAKLVVGGAPFLFDERLWREVGADAMGRCATDAPRIVEELRGGAAGARR
jgi:methanogenic corrinoid protein MtbC1